MDRTLLLPRWTHFWRSTRAACLAFFMSELKHGRAGPCKSWEPPCPHMQTELLLKCYTIKQHFKRKNLRSSCEFCLPLQVSDRPGQQYWLYCYLSIFFLRNYLSNFSPTKFVGKHRISSNQPTMHANHCARRISGYAKNQIQENVASCSVSIEGGEG